MITDRRRFGLHWEAALMERVAAAARAGVHLIQIREPDLDVRTLTSLVEIAVEAARGTPSRILVNDRVDVAIAAGAHGVHLRADSVSAARVRAIVPPGFVVGRSVHSREDIARAQNDGAIDYFLFGTVFETSSKPGVAAAGVEALRAASAMTTTPVLAIGGMTVARVADVGRAGAGGFAAIGLFADGPVEQLQSAAREAALVFDTPRTVP
jgi:thiamine-phosphate pyrophosphorylase